MNRLYRVEKYSPDCTRSTFGEYFSDWDKLVARTVRNYHFFSLSRSNFSLASSSVISSIGL